EFIAGAAEEVLPQLIATGTNALPAAETAYAHPTPPLLRSPAPFPPRSTTVLLDPPRKGCPPSILETLRQAACAQIIYVSCHPATMARDLNVLCRESVFELVKVVPLDMFPQTGHVESVADLRCKLEPPEVA